MIDTCASEFESYVPYFYSSYEDENESLVEERKKVIVLGSDPTALSEKPAFFAWYKSSQLPTRRPSSFSISMIFTGAGLRGNKNAAFSLW